MIVTSLVVLLLFLMAIVVSLVLFAAWTARRVEAAVPPVGRFITVDGVRLHYVDQGSGPVLLMIHGLASQLQSFTFALSALLPAYRLIILDRPGSGYSQAAASATLDSQADLIAAFTRALGVKRALVVGHSLGGAVSLALAILHPDLVAGLALLAPATQLQGKPPKALSALAIQADLMRWIIGWTLAIPSSLRARSKIRAALFKPDPIPDDFGTRGGHLLPLRPWTFRNASRDLMAAMASGAYLTRYGEISVPVSVLFGTGDRILDYRLHGESLVSQIAGVDLELIENGGHMVPLSAPERSAAIIERVAARAGMVPERVV
jgi:pimeloyl-ACP methyl ester carboxylesterase